MRELSEQLAQEMAETLLSYRHHFHSNPELSFQEFETAHSFVQN